MRTMTRQNQRRLRQLQAREHQLGWEMTNGGSYERFSRAKYAVHEFKQQHTFREKHK